MTSVIDRVPVTDIEVWPGGQQTLQASADRPDCTVTVRRPTGDISLVGVLGDGWQIVGVAGYNFASGTTLPATCGSFGAFSTGVANDRPSCSSALARDNLLFPGTASSATFVVETS
jgi:hypothetical protein